ncbi:efflux RND transporter permease subunit [Pseudodesulfovibrio sediminis]|uniref:Resistance-nodulation-cell division multidrug efflux transporter MexD n=1 Tax=Pseudodesulfovibrio sediminis TaxID=2810563 RepID=A0ABN6EWJ3_9BACT|nr:efflux RND transporter permease subunit [Pseudodesulfovibrio sediminis]BCS89883.1 resistance-nodulation-cell division multidrug efflux transporter MexD [Pseudodesulfovibrio sediminis]
MSDFFINRPNFAWVVAIFISLAGILAIPSLPMEKFPQVAPPQITLSLVYPGASASTLNDTVVSQIEEELNGAKGLLYYESTSYSNGTASITVTFKPGTDPDFAQVDVQNRLSNAESSLPQAVLDQGITVEQASSGFLMAYAMVYTDDNSDKDPQVLADLMARSVNNEIRRVEGVGKVQFFAAESAMRVWVDPQKLLSYDLSIADVNAAITKQNVQVPAGSFGSRPGNADQELSATLIVQGMLQTPEEFGQIVLHANVDGAVVTLSDVARIEVGPESYNFQSRLNGRETAVAAVQLAPGGNALSTVERVRARLDEIQRALPDGVKLEVPLDTSKFVDVAIEKVIHTLFEAIFLVFLVMFLFLQNFRYTLIPSIVVPVCLLGTFGVMYVVGFSINMMTMFGMVLAIGILVDDAIVVVENVERIMSTEGLPPKEATSKAMKQISGAVVGITLVLSAVFFPLGFMDGSVGIIYRQFAVSVAVSILISGFLALTMTPALCATLLKPVSKGSHEAKSGFFGWFNRRFDILGSGYQGLTSRLVGKTGRMMIIYVIILIALGYVYMRLPTAFVPSEDQGRMIISMQLPPGATYSRTLAQANKMEEFLANETGIENAFAVIGFSFSGQGQNAAAAFPMFKDWSERGEGESADDLILKANMFLSSINDGFAFAVNPPPIDGLGDTGGFALRIEDKAGMGREVLGQAVGMVLQQANASPVLAYARLNGLPDAPQLRLEIDRKQAETLGVSFGDINTVLSSAFGSSTINDFANRGRMQSVVVQADSKYRRNPESLNMLYVPNASGDQVPLTSVIKAKWETGPVQVVRYNGYSSFKLTGNPAPGYSSGEVMVELERIMQNLPKGIGYEWTELSYQEKQSGTQAPVLFSLALLVVFLLLVALYESWSIPLSVMLIVPIGALGSVAMVSVLGMSNDVYFKVGLITIIGLAAKNAILIVEFAKDLYSQGVGLKESAIQAARLRFRPIIMTSMAFILGVIPLAVATGAGAASQRAIGTGVIGGMLSASVLGIIFAPIFFVGVLSLVERFRGKGHKNTPDSTTTIVSE